MRHGYSGRKLNRRSEHRAAMLRNMAVSLFKYQTIKTTVPKAKTLRPLVEKLITMAKVDTVARRRLVFARLGNEDIVTKLFKEIAPRSKNRPGGYLRILKCGYRKGDAAPMAIVQWVDGDLIVPTEVE